MALFADRKALKELNDYMMTTTIGANNNHVVPGTPAILGRVFIRVHAGLHVKGFY